MDSSRARAHVLMRSESPLLVLARQGSSSTGASSAARSSAAPKEFKVVLIGPSTVGKSSLARREALDEFADVDNESYRTMATERFSTTLQVRQEPIQLHLFDTVGQERFMTLPSVLYRKASAVLICFDLSESRFAFDQIDKWFADAEKNAPTNALVLLVRTKADLPNRLVSAEECKAKARQLGVHLFDTSSKTGHNVKAMFHLIASQLSEDSRSAGGPSFALSPTPSTSPAAQPGPLAVAAAVSQSRRRAASPVPAAASVVDLSDRRSNSSDNPSSSSSCWMAASFFSASPPSPPPPPNEEEEEEEEEEGLAEVILKHANQRALSMAGGLRRGHHQPPPTRASPLSASSSVSAASATTTTTAAVPTTTTTPLRSCTLGCGAITAVATHETDECWLRSVPCPLQCGKCFPMLDCAAHERQECELRLVACACGERVQAKDVDAHTKAAAAAGVVTEEEDNAFAAPPPQTRQEMIHLLLSLFTKQELRVHVNLGEVKSASEEDVVNKALLTEEAKQRLHHALHGNIEIAPAGYAANWVEEEDRDPFDDDLFPFTQPSQPVERFSLANVVSLQRRNHLMRPRLLPNTASAAAAGSRQADNADNGRDFAATWRDLLDCKLSPGFMSDVTADAASTTTTTTSSSSHSRDVQVPLTLGSRVVTVRTIDFADLHELNSANKLGAGSFGSVYLAKYRGARVAVKHLHFQTISERELLREAAVMTSCCHHPHILRFLGVCLVRPNICYVSEALLCSLEDWLRFDKRNTPEPLGELLRFAEEAASGLFHLHLECVVHRDIAARNLLLDTGTPRRVKVCDFGLARVVAKQHREHGVTATTSTAATTATAMTGGSFDMTGPLKWMAPECLKAQDGLNCFSFASDVYSFAITLWELLAKDTPYPTLSPVDTAAQVLAVGLRPARAPLRPESTRALHQLLLSSSAPVASNLVFLMERAWDANAVNRPTMKQICSELGLLQDMLKLSSSV